MNSNINQMFQLSNGKTVHAEFRVGTDADEDDNFEFQTIEDLITIPALDDCEEMRELMYLIEDFIRGR